MFPRDLKSCEALGGDDELRTITAVSLGCTRAIWGLKNKHRFKCKHRFKEVAHVVLSSPSFRLIKFFEEEGINNNIFYISVWNNMYRFS